MYALYLIPAALLIAWGLWVWTLCDSLRQEREYLWLWLLVVIPPLSVPLYLVNFYVLGDEKRGLTSIRRGRHAERRILEIRHDLADGEIVGLREELAELLHERGRPEEALVELKPLLDRDPENLRAQYLAGRVLLELGRDEAALPHLDYLHGEDADYHGWRAAMLYASTLEKLGRDTEAISVYAGIMRGNSIPEVVYLYSRLLIKAGRKAEAVELLRATTEEFAAKPDYNAKRDRPWIARAKALLAETK